ncbi:MAG: DUF4010 domain-containing protein [Flavobacteriaceae bacterium]|nr:DUF4010 domain-containing protein [Flavobacteriaceae bacterium]
MDFFDKIPNQLVELVLVLLFSLSLGLEEHKRNPGAREKQIFGTDRTFAFIGILGYLLLLADPVSKIPYLAGMVILGGLLTVYYFKKIELAQNYGITSVVLGLITYGFPLFVSNSPHWLSLLFFVLVLTLTGMKTEFQKISAKIASDEFLTLAKFITIAGVILPLLPDNEIASFIPVSPYKIWLAVVVVSTISYLSYLLRKYAFPNAGLLLTGILGGLYSSTASTVILARKSREDDSQPKAYAASILVATAMMFLRIFILLLIFNKVVAGILLPYFAGLFLVSLGVSFAYYRQRGNSDKTISQSLFDDKNPLEFKVAIIFSLLYVLFSALTQLVITHFGQQGLNGLSVLVGFTDIDPFLLNLFQGNYQVSAIAIALATVQATASNNVLKALYAQVLSGHKTRNFVIKGFAVILLANMAAILLLHYFM